MVFFGEWERFVFYFRKKEKPAWAKSSHGQFLGFNLLAFTLINLQYVH